MNDFEKMFREVCPSASTVLLKIPAIALINSLVICVFSFLCLPFSKGPLGAEDGLVALIQRPFVLVLVTETFRRANLGWAPSFSPAVSGVKVLTGCLGLIPAILEAVFTVSVFYLVCVFVPEVPASFGSARSLTTAACSCFGLSITAYAYAACKFAETPPQHNIIKVGPARI